MGSVVPHLIPRHRENECKVQHRSDALVHVRYSRDPQLTFMLSIRRINPPGVPSESFRIIQKVYSYIRLGFFAPSRQVIGLKADAVLSTILLGSLVGLSFNERPSGHCLLSSIPRCSASEDSRADQLGYPTASLAVQNCVHNDPWLSLFSRVLSCPGWSELGLN